jgi:polyketide synthase 12
MSNEERLRYFLKRVSGELHDAKARLRELTDGVAEPLAVVGMSCRFPGGVRTPEDLWHLLVAGRDTVGEFPEDRGWDRTALRAECDVTVGGFLADAAEFDAGFFGISPREAIALDPQQRLLLETSWEAFERAGIDPRSLRGSRTGVFVGTNGQDYADLVRRSPRQAAGYFATGVTASVLSGRIAYTLGFEGPAVTVDTACSSSLVALHLAGAALHRGECRMALVGASTVMATPGPFVEFSRQSALAPDGRCKAFAAAADGTGWAEGTAVLLVERLADAVRDGHDVLAVVRGSSVNQDGASNGIAAPNGPSQVAVIRDALARSGLGAGQVDVVEAHGTGTTLGDPIEAGALLATYGRHRPPGRPLLLGSVKSNLGHTQAAAGLAGVIKMILALRHGTVPATLHVDAPTPHVDWNGGIRLPVEATPWPETGEPRRAGVSSFGVSGTNAHVILEQAPPAAVSSTESSTADGEPDDVPETRSVRVPFTTGGSVPWPVSARDEAALRAQARLLTGLLPDGAGEWPRDRAALDIGHSLATTRAAWERRAVVLAGGPDDTRTALAALASGDTARGLVRGNAVADGVVFVFPGQGAQWAGMALELLDTSPVFAARLAECADALRPFVSWSPADVLRGADGAPPAERVDVVQPLLFAVMVSLAALWEACGVRPAAVVGHSQGEIAAAVVAGALSIEDGARVVALRARALLKLAGTGGMASVLLPEDEVRSRLARFGDRLAVAAVNAPSAVTVSGEPAALDELVAECTADGIRARHVPVDYASHSPQVARLRDELHALLAEVAPRVPAVPMISTVTGSTMDEAGLDAGYWYRNLRQTVRFEEAVRALTAQGHRAFLEVSPHPVLTMAVRESLAAAGGDGVALGTLRRDDGGQERFLTSLAEAHVHGIPVSWPSVFAGSGARRVPLPTYPFQRRRYWLRPETGAPVVSTVDSWVYRVAWRPVPEVATPRLTGRWLVLRPPSRGGDEQAALTDSVIAALTSHGADVVPVDVDGFADPVADRVVTLCAGTGADAPDHPVGVLSLLPLDERPDQEHPDVTVGVLGTLALVRALAGAGVATRLWCATRGAVAATGDDVLGHEAQAQVWGLGRVAALEHPGQWGGLLDLPVLLDASSADRLAVVLAGETGEDQLALRSDGLFARRLVRALPETTARPERTVLADTGKPGGWSPPGTVLITGGTGALGGHVARWLAGAGARRLVLVSRRGEAAPGAADLVAELRATGTSVTALACDIADRDAVAELVTGLAEAGTPVQAVVHAAGVGQFAPLAETGPADVAAILRAKVTGARHLDELLGDDLSAFVLFSSNAGVWGSGGQAVYAAANAHLDALAQRRRARGQAATAIAWGAWAGGGMAEDETAARHLNRRGVRPMPPAEALRLLRRALDHDETFLAVADVDWELFARAFTSVRPSRLLAEIPEAAPEPDLVDDTGVRHRELAGLASAEREHALRDLVRRLVADVLGHDSPDAVDDDRPLRDLGFDSLTAVELRDRLSVRTGLALPVTVVFDHPTVAALAGHLTSALAGTFAGAGPVITGADSGPASGPADDPVAIVAMGCRFPGGVRSAEDLWDLIAGGKDAITEFPRDRGWALAQLLGGGGDRPGASRTGHGGFLSDAAGFDADFFGISPREARAMDPQQRQVLEVSWETVERAGIDPTTLRGTATGVFVGASPQGYGPALGSAPAELEGYVLTGAAGGALCGRVAYTLGLEGPAVTVDTACSSALVAVHLAMRALRQGDCTMALAGGVAVMATPGGFVEFSRQDGLAEDGRCKSFASAADGTGWSEGVGMVLLERLSDARRHGHPVLALLRGSSVNQDGASNGLSAPSGPAQQRVIRQALADSGLRADQVDAVEAHGTGTRLGDPIEAQALLATYGQGRQADPLWLGSVKSNLGHTQAAAGAAGLIKTVLALRHAFLPPTLHVDAPTPHVDWDSGAVRLLTEARRWPVVSRPRRAGVSAFGLGGTNAHVIVEEPPAEAVEVPDHTDRLESCADPVGSTAAPVVWPISARTPEALRAQADGLRTHVLAHPELEPADIGYALARTRTGFEHRAVVWGHDRDECAARLALLAGGSAGPGLITGVVRRHGRVAFLFPGQGSQRRGMGRELYDTYPRYADAFDEVSAHLDGGLDIPLRELLFAPGSPSPDDTAHAQPALFAVEVALFRLVTSWGLRPDFVAGHSVGELAAAHVAGVLSLADAARLVTARGRLMGALPDGGAMLAVRTGERRMTELIAELPADEAGTVSLAAVNGPGAVVVSGAAGTVHRIAQRCAEEGVRTSTLRVSHAFHSPYMDGMVAEFRSVAESVTYHAAALPIVSTVSGVLADDQVRTPEYWARQAREPVRFGDALDTLAAAGVTTYLEMGPGGALSTIGQDRADGGAFVPVLRSGRPEPESLTVAMAEAHVRGAGPDWAETRGGRPVDLPVYPFQHQRFWFVPPVAAGLAPSGLDRADHPLLAAVVESPESGGFSATALLSLSAQPWLADHTVWERPVLAGTVLVDLAWWAVGRSGGGTLGELTLHTPVTLSEQEDRRLHLSVGAPGDDGARTVSVYSRPAEQPAGIDGFGVEWVRHATGRITPTAEEPPADSHEEWPPEEATPVDLSGFYGRRSAVGYGPAFQGMVAAWRHGTDLLVEARLPDGVHTDPSGFGLHPALLDAALQAMALGEFVPSDAAGAAWLPFSWSGVSQWATGVTAIRVRLSPVAPGVVTVLASDMDGRSVAAVDALELRPVPSVPDSVDGALHHAHWFPAGDEADLTEQSIVEMSADLPGPDDPVPGLVAVAVPAPETDDAVAGAHQCLTWVLDLVRRWLADDRFAAARLAVVTTGAVAVRPGAEVPDVTVAPVWGLVRSAQSEHPDRLLLVDSDGRESSTSALAAAIRYGTDAGETQLAVRDGAMWVCRLERAPTPDLVVPATLDWRLDLPAPGAEAGTVDAVTTVDATARARSLEPGEVRVAVRAAGVNFRDVLVALGLYPGTPSMGIEGAGVVTEVGPSVPGLRAGDRVMGLVPEAFGPVAVADHRTLAAVPAGLSFAEAASIPVAYLTAYHGLVTLAGLRAGQKVLVHAAAGGVGMAAVRLASHLGAEVFATASPAKWDTVRALGVPQDHLASSRNGDFERRVLAATGGEGVDVVLNSLTGDLTDAGLRLLSSGGFFVELGKADPRDPGEVARRHPGVTYRAFDLDDPGPDNIARMFAELAPLWDSRALPPLPVRAWDIRDARSALRFVSQARHTGKVVLTVPAAMSPQGTVLVTGASGALGGQVARHLVAEHGVRHLLLASRGGHPPTTAADLAGLGADVSTVACDVSDRAAVADLLAAIPAEHPLTAVVHCAGVLDDGLVEDLTPDRLARVLHPKVDAAWHLHSLTAGHDLAAFILFSSAAGVVGAPGQAGYAAANVFLDVLAAHRRGAGLPGMSLAWGWWAGTDTPEPHGTVDPAPSANGAGPGAIARSAGMAGGLAASDLARMRRSGMAPLSVSQGLALLDEAIASVASATVVPLRMSRTVARGMATGPLRSLLAGRHTAPAAPGGAAHGPARPPSGAGRDPVAITPRRTGVELLELVRAEAALVLGHVHGGFDPDRPFRELGFDSLTSVELRNRLGSATGLRLPAGVVFDQPTARALAEHLAHVLGEGDDTAEVLTHLDHLESALGSAVPGGDGRARIAMRLRALLATVDRRADDGAPADGVPGHSHDDELLSASDDELFDVLDNELEVT